MRLTTEQWERLRAAIVVATDWDDPAPDRDVAVFHGWDQLFRLRDVLREIEEQAEAIRAAWGCGCRLCEELYEADMQLLPNVSKGRLVSLE